MMKWILIPAMLLACSNTAFAVGTNPARSNYGAGNDPVMRQAMVACGPELASICAKKVGDSAKVRCLRANASRVSPGCRAVLQ